MAVLTVYGNVNDAQIESSNAVYATARAGSGFFVSTGTVHQIGQYLSGGLYVVKEYLVSFDTTVLPPGAVVTSAVLSIKGGGVSPDESVTDFTIEARTKDFGASVDAADWVAGADLAALTLRAHFDTSAGWSSDYNVFTDDALAAAIAVDGTTYLLLCSSRHRNNNAPTGLEQVGVKAVDTTGTADDPKLVITYSAPPLAPTLTTKESFDATQAAQFAWTFNDDAGDTQSAFQLRIYRVSDGVMVHDTGKVASAVSSRTVPGGTLTNGVAYQWEVKTWDQGDLAGPYSALGAFNTSQQPTTAITSPATNGEVVIFASHLVTWTFTDPEAGIQTAYRVVLKDSLGAVISTTGKVMDSAARSYTLTGLVVGNYSVEVTTWDALDVASNVAVRTFTVLYTPPPQPVITVEAM
jgi:hypothetical protein